MELSGHFSCCPILLEEAVGVARELWSGVNTPFFFGTENNRTTIPFSAHHSTHPLLIPAAVGV